jgi:hypothetical protein
MTTNPISLRNEVNRRGPSTLSSQRSGNRASDDGCDVSVGLLRKFGERGLIEFHSAEIYPQLLQRLLRQAVERRLIVREKQKCNIDRIVTGMAILRQLLARNQYVVSFSGHRWGQGHRK